MPAVSDTFNETWRREAHLEFTQGESKFKGKTEELRDKGTKGHVPFFSNEEAREGKSRHADVDITAQNTSDVTVTPTVIYAAYMVDDWDLAQLSYDYRAMINRKATEAVWRKYDDLHITAIDATSNAEVSLPSANTMNYAGFVEMAEQLDLNDVPHTNRFGSISPGASTDLLNDSTYINNFHNTNNAVKTGEFGDVAGFNAFKTTRLSNGAAGATERRCQFWQKSAVITYIPKDFEIDIQWVAMKQGFLYVASMLVGVKILDNKGVFFCDVTN